MNNTGACRMTLLPFVVGLKTACNFTWTFTGEVTLKPHTRITQSSYSAFQYGLPHSMSEQSPLKKQNVSQEVANVVFTPEDWRFWQCLICHDVVVDAVQMVCCGGLYCRRCVLLWLQEKTTCPSCRHHATPDNVSSDVRSERLAASVMRPCAQAHLGCTFKGNREKADEHAWLCGFLPRPSIVSELHRNKELLKCSAQDLMKVIQAALGPNAALDAMRVLHKLDETTALVQIKKTKRSVIHCCNLRCADAHGVLELQQSHYIGMRLRNTGNCDFQVHFNLTILHPSNPLLSKRVSFLRNGRDVILSANSEEAQEVMPCDSFGNFCANGYFFIATQGHVITDA
jgi:hypothetical protein